MNEISLKACTVHFAAKQETKILCRDVCVYKQHNTSTAIHNCDLKQKKKREKTGRQQKSVSIEEIKRVFLKCVVGCSCLSSLI